MPYMQRLIEDDKTGFNYDHMAYEEFTMAAQRMGRTAIAEAFVNHDIACVRTMLQFYTMGYSDRRTYEDPIDVVIVTTVDVAKDIGDTYKIRCDRTSARSGDKKYVAWMNVWSRDESIPMLVVRADCPDLMDRVNSFFRDPIRAAKAELEPPAENIIVH